jgi:hypothetical protein
MSMMQDYLRQIEIQNKENKGPKKGFATKEAPVISGRPGMKPEKPAKTKK